MNPGSFTDIALWREAHPIRPEDHGDLDKVARRLLVEVWAESMSAGRASLNTFSLGDFFRWAEDQRVPVPLARAAWVVLETQGWVSSISVPKPHEGRWVPGVEYYLTADAADVTHAFGLTFSGKR